MGDVLEAIAQAVGEFVGRVDPPLQASLVVVVVVLDTVCRSIPKSRVLSLALKILLLLLDLCRVIFLDLVLFRLDTKELLHPQQCLTRLVLAIPHGPEVLQVVLD